MADVQGCELMDGTLLLPGSAMTAGGDSLFATTSIAGEAYITGARELFDALFRFRNCSSAAKAKCENHNDENAKTKV